MYIIPGLRIPGHTRKFHLHKIHFNIILLYLVTGDLIQPLGRDLNRQPSEYEARVLNTTPQI